MSKYDKYEVYSWATNALAFIEKEQKIKVAEYARGYEWDSQKCGELLDEFATADARGEHIYFGSILYTIRRMEKTKDLYKNVYEVTVIDGQQRITTLIVFLAAMRFILKKNEKAESADHLISAIDHLIMLEMDGKRGLRFIPTTKNGEDEILRQIMDEENYPWVREEFGKDTPTRENIKNSNVWKNFHFLAQKFDRDGFAKIQKYYEIIAEEVYFVEVSFRDDGKHDLREIYENVNGLKK